MYNRSERCLNAEPTEVLVAVGKRPGDDEARKSVGEGGYT
jgi:hypothetical protein